MNSRTFFTDRKVVFLLASLCCLLWGSAYPAIKNGYALFGIAPGDIPSQLVFAGCRFLFAGLVLLVLASIQGKAIFHFGRRTWGQSMVVDAWGQVLAQQAEGAGVVLAELDSAALAARRQQLPALGHRVLLLRS